MVWSQTVFTIHNPRPGYFVGVSDGRNSLLTEDLREAESFMANVKTKWPSAVYIRNVTVFDESYDNGKTFFRKVWHPL